MDAVLEKGGGCNQDHGTVDTPTDQHRKECIQGLILELVSDDRLVLDIPLPALDDL